MCDKAAPFRNALAAVGALLSFVAAAIIRKNSLCNRRKAVANAQAIMMSAYRTLKLRGLDPLETIVSAIRGYISTGPFPPLPAWKVSDG